MSDIQRVADLEIDQDMQTLERTWKMQRIGWAIMLLIVLLALFGGFGRGLLASATVGDDNGPLRMEYDRMTRHSSPTSLRIHLAGGAAPNGEARIRIGRDYLQGVKVDHITPEPESVEVDKDSVVYVFRVADPGQPTTIKFELEPDEY